MAALGPSCASAHGDSAVRSHTDRSVVGDQPTHVCPSSGNSVRRAAAPSEPRVPCALARRYRERRGAATLPLRPLAALLLLARARVARSRGGKHDRFLALGPTTPRRAASLQCERQRLQSLRSRHRLRHFARSLRLRHFGLGHSATSRPQKDSSCQLVRSHRAAGRRSDSASLCIWI